MTVHASEEAPETLPAPSSPQRRFVARSPLWIGAALAVLAAVLVSVTAHRGQQLSPFDEWTHADYAWRLAHGQVPAAGTTVAPEILNEFACRGVTGYQPHLPPCGQADPQPSQFPAKGEDYNFGHPPLYYGVTGVLARVADAVVPGDHFLVLARLVGILWLWAAMLVLYLGVRALGAPRKYAGLAAALLPLLPGVLRACSTVNNDAAGPLSGALALMVFARFVVQKRTGLVLPMVAAFVLGATKVLNLMPLLVVTGVIFVIAVRRWREGDRLAARQAALVVAGIGAVSLLVYKGWALVQAGRGDPNWISPIAGVTGRPVEGMPFRELTSSLLSGMSPEHDYVLPSAVNGQSMLIWARALDVVLVAAPLMAMVTWSRRTIGWLLGLVTLVALVAYPEIVQLQVYLTDRSYFRGVNSRYGISIEPLALACLALVAWKRQCLRLAITGLGVGAAAVVASLTGLV